MQQLTKIHPFLTYNSLTQELEFHGESIIQNANKSQNFHTVDYETDSKISFVNVIQVKQKYYKALMSESSSLQFQHHGIHISQSIYCHQLDKQIKYLILPPNQIKIPQKYQDLFSYLLLSLSNVTIFDISSKYLRNHHHVSKNNGQKDDKFSYVMMNTKSSNQFGQVYKVHVSSCNNKMELSNKIQNDNKSSLLREFIVNVKHDYDMYNIAKLFKQLIQGKFLLKNYINFQEIQYSFLGNLRLQKYLQSQSIQYVELINKKQKLSIKQLENLQNSINQFSSPEFYTQQHLTVLKYIKKCLKSKLRSINKGYTDSFLLNLKNQYFVQVVTFQQLSIKKKLSQKILQQYGISKIFMKLLYSQTQNKIQSIQIQKLMNRIEQKQKTIQDYMQKLQKNEKLLQKTSQLLSMYEDKNIDYKKLNEKYKEKCQQLENQKFTNIKNRQEIEALLSEQEQKKNTQQNLHKYIIEILQSKNQQQHTISAQQSQLRSKQQYALELSQKITNLQKKIKWYQSLQSKYFQAQQTIKCSKDELSRYKTLLNNLQDHFQSFKKSQIQKFNYALQKNYQFYTKLKVQNEKKSKVIKSQQQKINKLTDQIQQQRHRLRYCQDQVIKIIQNKEQKNKEFVYGAEQQIWGRRSQKKFGEIQIKVQKENKNANFYELNGKGKFQDKGIGGLNLQI